MKIKVKQEDGTEVEQEVFTDAEVKERETAALDQWKKDHPDQGEAMTKMQEDLRIAKEALEAVGGDKGQNFIALRTKVQQMEDAIKNSKNEALAEVNKVRDEMSGAALDAAVQGLAGEDAELAKKVRFHFETTLKSVVAKDKAELTRKIQQAYLLAAGREPDPNILSGAMYGSGGAGPGAGAGGGSGGGSPRNPIKPELVEMGKKYFGLSDDDFKKFDKRDFSRTK